ncbi:MAG: helix-turn-helix domain-containing protein [Acidimicrobiales bacterium]
MRVAIVDDDLWVRHGRAAALGREPGYEVIEMSPREAIAFGASWAEIDVALVDAHDATEPFDRFPGVRVVEAIRSDPGENPTLIIVISGHFGNAFLRLRMAEAGADYFYRHQDVKSLDLLLAAIEKPDPARRVRTPEPSVLAKLGLGPRSRPNAALHFLEDEGLVDVFEGRRSQKTLALSRRSIMRVRREMARLAGLSPASPVSASRRLDAPEWRAVVEFVNRARGVERRGTGGHTGPLDQPTR